MQGGINDNTKSFCSNIVNEWGVKNPQNLVNVVYERPLTPQYSVFTGFRDFPYPYLSHTPKK